MLCNKCSNNGVEVTVLGITSYYCRTCKTDINLESPPADPGNSSVIFNNGTSINFTNPNYITGTYTSGTWSLPSSFPMTVHMSNEEYELWMKMDTVYRAFRNHPNAVAAAYGHKINLQGIDCAIDILISPTGYTTVRPVP